VIRNFIIICLVSIKHSYDEHKEDKIAKRVYRKSCMTENIDTYKTLVRKPESKGPSVFCNRGGTRQ